VHRIATLKDVSALIALEHRCFDVERLSVSNFRYLLTRAKSQTLIDEVDAQMRGYVTVLWRRHLNMGRIYSIAVDTPFRGQHVGPGLLNAVEVLARQSHYNRMRAEIREDNIASQRMFARLGYNEDHHDALRVEKILLPEAN
jgi:ribosomal protein S18 acetylase RimI-like enzyme